MRQVRRRERIREDNKAQAVTGDAWEIDDKRKCE